MLMRGSFSRLCLGQGLALFHVAGFGLRARSLPQAAFVPTGTLAGATLAAFLGAALCAGVSAQGAQSVHLDRRNGSIGLGADVQE